MGGKGCPVSTAFFWGLILGDFIIGGSWLAIGAILDLRQIYINMGVIIVPKPRKVDTISYSLGLTPFLTAF